MSQIDWSKAPAGYPIWLEDIRPNRVGSDRSCWARAGKGEYDLQDGGYWSYSAHGTQYIAHNRMAWTGEGLPPAGAIVHCGTHNRDVEILKTPEIVRHANGEYVTGACRALDNQELFWGGQFSPISTPEQIAAEERDAAVAQMKQCFDSISERLMPTSNQYLETLFGALYDAGCRMPSKGAKP